MVEIFGKLIFSISENKIEKLYKPFSVWVNFQKKHMTDFQILTRKL